MPDISGILNAPSGSGSSAIAHSVVSKMAAAETACCTPARSTLLDQ